MALDCTLAGIIEDAACASYSFDCVDETGFADPSCTSEEQAAGATKAARICTTGKICAQMQSVPTMYKDAQCCTTDECNLPPDMLETTEDEGQAGSATGSSGECVLLRGLHPPHLSILKAGAPMHDVPDAAGTAPLHSSN